MKITFSTSEKELLINKLQRYFNKELDVELGQFDGDFLLDFISENIGAYFYNRGLQDAQTILNSKIETLNEAIAEIEISTEFSR